MRRYSKPRKVKLSPFFRSTIRLLSSLISMRSFANSSRSRLSIAFTSHPLFMPAFAGRTLSFIYPSLTVVLVRGAVEDRSAIALQLELRRRRGVHDQQGFAHLVWQPGPCLVSHHHGQ